MAKFYGAIGYAETTETAPGVWVQQITERMYAGDVVRRTRRLENGEGLNDNITISGQQISIVADPYAYQHFHSMAYIQYMGAYWKITSVEVEQPRLILSLGGVYNGETA